MKVLYFAELKEILNVQSEEININSEITVDVFKQTLIERHPQIAVKQFQIAVNEEFVQSDAIIQQNDIVALIPPVSGG